MADNLFDAQLQEFDIRDEESRLAATREVMQRFALAGLHRGGFFEHAAFYGGTALRIFYGLNRFSEDLDFSTLALAEDFLLERYFATLIEEFALAERQVST